ncbi:MAG: fumarylacetoacetate hydrolase family protein [Verrucomicrobiota bacterium]
MKLLRHGRIGEEKPGIQLEDGTRIDASGFGQDWDSDFFADPAHLDQLSSWVESNAASAPKIAEGTRLGPCVATPGKLICIGLNYSDHAKEAGMEIPTQPIVFFKATSAIVGPNDAVVIPKDSQKTDWEVELAIVIGKRANYVSKEDALDYVAGYCLHNDYSEREFQLERGGQWVKGKSCDTFAPLGPFVATKDEIADVQDLGMWLKVNGEEKQNGNTSTMIFDVAELVADLSRYMSLMPGDVISTGTPPGVGMGFNPPQYMKPGDVIELGIDGLGESSQTAEAWSA